MKFIRARPLAPDPWEISSGQPGFERETYEGASSLLPELEIFGWLRFHATLSGALQPDRHPWAFEVHYLRRGHLNWWVEEEKYAFSAGHVFIVRPGELHGGDEGALQACEHYWLRLRFPKRRALPALTADETLRLRLDFERLRVRNYPASPQVREYFESLHEAHRHASQPHARPMARALLHALLILILRDHERQAQAAHRGPMTTWRVRRVQEALHQRLLAADASIAGLAAEVGLSPAGLRARFKAETGFTLHEYALHHRVDKARHRLAETEAEITAIAHDLGFSSSQYFATVFRRQVGLTPGDYRRRHRGVSSKPGGATSARV